MIILFFQRQHLQFDTFVYLAKFVTWYPCFLKKHTKETFRDMLAFFLLESNEIMLLLMKEKEEEWFCFFQEANFHFIDKQYWNERDRNANYLINWISINLRSLMKGSVEKGVRYFTQNRTLSEMLQILHAVLFRCLKQSSACFSLKLASFLRYYVCEKTHFSEGIL